MKAEFVFRILVMKPQGLVEAFFSLEEIRMIQNLTESQTLRDGSNGWKNL